MKLYKVIFDGEAPIMPTVIISANNLEEAKAIAINFLDGNCIHEWVEEIKESGVVFYDEGNISREIISANKEKRCYVPEFIEIHKQESKVHTPIKLNIKK